MRLVSLASILTGMWISACGMVAEPDAMDAPLTPGVSSLELADALAANGTLTPDEARLLLSLGSEQGFDVFVTPAVPGPSDLISMVLVFPQGEPVPSGGMARVSVDRWDSEADVAGRFVTVIGRNAMLVELGRHPVGAEVRFAIRLGLGAEERWLNNGYQDYRVAVTEPQAVAWVGDIQVIQDGLVRSLPADPLFAGHATRVMIDTYPQTTEVRATLRYYVDQSVSEQAIPMSIQAIDQGPHHANSRWVASIPAAAIGKQGRVRLAIDVEGPMGSLVVLGGTSALEAVVQAAPLPSWGEVGVYRFSKATSYAWTYQSGLVNPLDARPDQYGAYAWAPMPAVELYVPGVTDTRDAAVADFVKVEVWSPFFSGRVNGAWKGYAIPLREVVGNNFRYQWRVRITAAPYMPPMGVDFAEAGTYPFKFRVSTDGGEHWSWLGTGPLPDGGDNRFFLWDNVSYVAGLTVSGDTIFPKTRVNNTVTRSIEFVNTNNHTAVLTGITLDDPTGSWVLACDACPDLSTCALRLAPGDRFALLVTFAPKVSGAVLDATLNIAQFAQEEPNYLKGIQQVSLIGSARK